MAVLPGSSPTARPTIRIATSFIVEGDSAGGSAKQARDKEFQAVLPLKGKPKNTWQDDPDTLYSNKEIEAIALAIGVDHHKASDNPDLSGLRYKRIIILADADVDGSHIQVLLLTLFFRHFPKLIELGHVHVAKPRSFASTCRRTARIGPRASSTRSTKRSSMRSAKLIDEGVRRTISPSAASRASARSAPEQWGDHARSRYAPHAAGRGR